MTSEEYKELKKKLFSGQKNGYDSITEDGLTAMDRYCADYIAFLFPECVMAYNLDGGGSTNVVLKGERIHTTPGHRQISDILYFATAIPESERGE